MLDQHGAKSKYLLFAPLYLLLYWLVNPVTIVTTFWAAVKTILGRGSGTWVSPERKQLL
ncbi:hypothetical protein IV55_GL000993 [Furfurilactobacillus siliginis]|uniref:Uncharacterized protein n=1 Tax=Furfurilactobacillus siliginis TaxID=348151 RepID=A0A0R2L129_9LACO|nr:hypothetical protein IV55_GL000993 [Furfurilactobacillus siliginis]